MEVRTLSFIEWTNGKKNLNTFFYVPQGDSHTGLEYEQ